MLNRPKKDRKTVITISIALFLAVPLGCHAQSNNSVANNNQTPSVAKPAEVDAARAYDHVKKLVALGPHPSGSEAIKQVQTYIENEFRSFGL
jgi:hypothetical protein